MVRTGPQPETALVCSTASCNRDAINRSIVSLILPTIGTTRLMGRVGDQSCDQAELMPSQAKAITHH
ncbi:MAG: hypothetical protein EB096_13330 [Betaproteobacteria bacterium]|nr:hypothetical protein [Betaproteobacteria bacterium]